MTKNYRATHFSTSFITKMKSWQVMWNQLEDALVAELEFKNFVDAFVFMTDVAALAEQQQHHPEWSNVYNRVTIRLTTHDAGNQVTEKDRKLAKAIEALASASLVQVTG